MPDQSLRQIRGGLGNHDALSQGELHGEMPVVFVLLEHYHAP